MKRREESRGRHPNTHYVEIALPENGINGLHHFRIPSPLQAPKLLEHSDETGAQMRSMGAIIGASWHHEWLDLETPESDDLVAYGEAVFEELHAAGYRMEWMLMFQQLVVIEIGKLSQVSKEVRERLGFSKLKTVNNASSSSESLGLPTETSTLSTA